ncbi:MAG: PIG-L family deacetylase [Thermomicrobiales bacterium]|nr:PIG-L family deacetylase [Thermomicrobiales bacterium]
MSTLISPAALTAPDTHLFISPHYDDIALSCGGTAALVAEAGKDAVVGLLFGDHPDPAEPLTDFAKSLHDQWRMDAEEVIAGRRAEEAASCRILGLRDVFLPFRDALYRGANYLNDDQLFGALRGSDHDLPERIVAAIAAEGFRPVGARAYAPLASGFHVDHQLAFQAGVLLASYGWEVWFYEDLPYSLLENRVGDRISRAGEHLESAAAVDVSSVWTKKIDAIMAYPSQLKVIFESYVGAGSSREAIDQVMSEYSKEAGGGRHAERFWQLAS